MRVVCTNPGTIAPAWLMCSAQVRLSRLSTPVVTSTAFDLGEAHVRFRD
jgi:hypothetical protein